MAINDYYYPDDYHVASSAQGRLSWHDNHHFDLQNSSESSRVRDDNYHPLLLLRPDILGPIVMA